MARALPTNQMQKFGPINLNPNDQFGLGADNHPSPKNHPLLNISTYIQPQQ